MENGAISSVGISIDLGVPGRDMPVMLDGTQTCTLFFEMMRAWDSDQTWSAHSTPTSVLSA